MFKIHGGLFKSKGNTLMSLTKWGIEYSCIKNMYFFLDQNINVNTEHGITIGLNNI